MIDPMVQKSIDRYRARQLAADPEYLAAWGIDVKNPADSIGRVFYLGEARGSNPQEIERLVADRWGKWFGPDAELRVTKLLGLVSEKRCFGVGMVEVKVVASNSGPCDMLIDALHVVNVTGDSREEIEMKAITRASAFVGSDVGLRIGEEPVLRSTWPLGGFHPIAMMDPADRGELYADSVEIQLVGQDFVVTDELIRTYERMRRIDQEQRLGGWR